MSPKQLLAYFDRIAEAPGAVPRLRRFILDLAVRGKLVQQDPCDEPPVTPVDSRNASTSKSHVGIAQQSSVPSDNVTFPLPSKWAWAHLKSVCLSVTDGDHLPPPKTASGIPFLVIGNIRGRRLDFDGCRYVSEDYYNGLDPRRQPTQGDILYTLVGSFGIPVIVADDRAFCVQRHIGILRPSNLVDVRYLARALESDFLFSQASACATGIAQKTIPLSGLRRFCIPLPPVAEQKRIVAKVDALMALCDRLEAAQTERELRRERYLRSSLVLWIRPVHGARVQSATKPGHVLNSVIDSAGVRQARKAVLDLAVRGRLVRQHANDEPVEELLQRVLEHKAAASKTMASRLTVRRRAEHHFPWQIPDSWAWVQFGDVVVQRDGERVPISKEERAGRKKLYDYYGASGVIDKIDGYLFDKPLLLIGEDGANLLNRSTPIAFIARGKYWVNNHAHVIDGISESFLRYLELHINAIDLTPYITGAAQPKMNQAKMNSIPIALPPLAEQHRILAKVDELLSICERLDAQLTSAQDGRKRLLEAVLQRALIDAAEQPMPEIGEAVSPA